MLASYATLISRVPTSRCEGYTAHATSMIVNVLSSCAASSSPCMPGADVFSACLWILPGFLVVRDSLGWPYHLPVAELIIFLCAEYNMRMFKPRASVMEGLRPALRQLAVDRANAQFESLFGSGAA